VINLTLDIATEFVVVDLGTAEQFARGRLMGAQHLPEGTSSFVDDFGYERRDKLLAYAHLPSDRVAPTDPRLAIFHQQKYLKEILILEGKPAFPFYFMSSKAAAAQA
jgi:hypothetical protein